MQLTHSTKQRLLDVGQAMLLKHGYHDLGIQALLAATRTPKGSFYHHFVNKEHFALQVIDQYMRQVHAGLDACLGDQDRPPLERVRRFFELTGQSYRGEGYLGCLLGGLGQELSGVSEVFRRKIEECFSPLPGGSRCAWRRPARGATFRPSPIRGAWRVCWWTAGRAQPCAAGCGGMPCR